MKCTFKKENNDFCNANAMRGAKYCYLHNPEISEEEKFNVQSNGGKGNAIKVFEPLESIKIQEPSDVVLLLADTINKVRVGEMDLRVANCIGYLSGHLIKACEVSNLSQKLDSIERAVAKK